MASKFRGKYLQIIPLGESLCNKLQFDQVLTATYIDCHIENSKNDKKVILAIITSPKRQCADRKSVV